MLKQRATPNTLTEAIRYFADADVSLAFVVQLRWPSGVTCPHCKAEKPSFLTTRRIWKCLACRKQFSVKVGTIFEDSHIPLDKWLAAIWMIANCKNGVSSYEIGREIGKLNGRGGDGEVEDRVGILQERRGISSDLDAQRADGRELARGLADGR